MPRLKGSRHPLEVIARAVWAYHRFALNTAEVEDLLAERDVIVSRQAQRFSSAHDQFNLILRPPPRYQLTKTSYRHIRNNAFNLWVSYTA